MFFVRERAHSRVLRGEDVVAEAKLTLVCIDRGGRACRIPAFLREAFAARDILKPTEGAHGNPD